jgi:hypothetical protein
VSKVPKVLKVLPPQAIMANAEGNLHGVLCARVDASLKSSYEYLGRVPRDKAWNEKIESN